MEKELIKMGTMHSLGTKFDDLLEASEAAVHKHDGGKEYLQMAYKNIMAILGHIDKDLDENKYDLDTAKLLKDYIQKAAGVTRSLVGTAEIGHNRASGKVEALKSVIKVTQKEHSVEKQKYEAKQASQPILEGIEIEETSVRRPGPPLKAQRQAEEKPKRKRGRPKKKKDGEDT